MRRLRDISVVDCNQRRGRGILYGQLNAAFSASTGGRAFAITDFGLTKYGTMTPVICHQAAHGNPQLQRLILRLAAVMAILTIPAVLLPRMAVEKLSWMIGFGQPSDVPLIYYLVGGGSAVYVLLSAMLWLISGDMVRYRPLVVFSAWAFLACGPIYLSIDLQSRMPLWWVTMDTASCLAAGAALLWACYRPSRGPGAAGGG
jgi:hypothetical protein